MRIKVDYGFIRKPVVKKVVGNEVKVYPTTMDCWSIHIFGYTIPDRADYLINRFDMDSLFETQFVEFKYDVKSNPLDKKFATGFNHIKYVLKHYKPLEKCESFEEALNELSGHIIDLNESFRYDEVDESKCGSYWNGTYEKLPWRNPDERITKYVVYTTDYGLETEFREFGTNQEAWDYCERHNWKYTDEQYYTYHFKIKMKFE